MKSIKNALSTVAVTLDSRPWLSVVLCMVVASIAWWTMVVATAWTDEVFYVDPGACLALGKGFSSNGWSELGGGAPWGLSNPGTPLLLSGWFTLFGFGQYQSHTFFFVAQVAGVLLIVSWAGQRWNLRPAERAGLFLLGLFLHSLSGNSMYHARPDAFALLLYGWFLKFSFPSKASGVESFISAVFFGIACVFFGLQFCGYFPIVALAVFVWFRQRHLFEVGLGQALGLGIGVFLLWFFYGKAGTWGAFIENRSENFGRHFGWGKFAASKEFLIFFPALLALVASEFFLRKSWASDVAKAAFLALGVMLLTPLCIQKIGLYQPPYSWMVAVPVLLLVLPSLSGLSFNHGGWFKWALIIMAAGSLVLRVRAVPGELLESRKRREMMMALEKCRQPGDLVLGSMPLYYEIRQSGSRAVWTYDFRLPPKKSVSEQLKWLLITEGDAKVLKGRLPGAWEQVLSSEESAHRPHYGRYLLLKRVDSPK